LLSRAGHRRHPHRLLRGRDDLPDPRPRPRIREFGLQPRLHARARHGHSLRRAHRVHEPARGYRPGMAQPEAEVRMSPPAAAPDSPESGGSLWTDAWRRLRRNRLALFGGAVLAVLALLCAFGPLFSQSYREI